MSRHKLVKTMNLDDELDDFDGADFDDGYDESEACKTLAGTYGIHCTDQTWRSDC